MFENDTDRLDQHFLVDKDVIQKFIEEGHYTKDNVVVEIGPGEGYITSLIAKKVKKMYCIELDNRLKEHLMSLDLKNVEFIFNNALEIYIPECNKVVTALPYSIIEPFINKMIKCEFEELLMITGKKYAKSVIEGDINKLSLLTNCFFKCEYITDISPTAFKPSPRVWSSMIRLIPKKDEEETNFNMIIFKYMFKYRKKTVYNALIESLITYHKLKNKELTQRQSKDIINKIENKDNELFSKVFSTCSNEDLIKINKIISKIEKTLDFN